MLRKKSRALLVSGLKMPGFALLKPLQSKIVVSSFRPKEDMAMAIPTRPDPKLIRASIALVWLYEGLWCKLLGGVPRHAEVIAAAPFIGPAAAGTALILLGLVECGIAVWVLSGRRMCQAALVQTVLLVAMNAGGTMWARRLISDPGGMIVQNLAFLVLIWIAAEESPHVAHA